MCIYFFVFFFLTFVCLFLFVSVWNPDATKWTLIVALKISSINESCFKSHYVKQDLNISERILAAVWAAVGTTLFPPWPPSQLPCALRTWTDRVQNFYVPKLSVTLALSLFSDAVLSVRHVLLWCYIDRFVCSFNVTYNKMCLVADCPESILNEEV